MRSRVFALSLALALAACSDAGASPDADASAGDADAAPIATVGEDLTVVAFAGEHVYFGDPNRREVDTTVELPAAGASYERIVLSLTLGCPNGRCDWWDRRGHLSIVEPDAAGEPREIELARFVTPYRVGGSWQLDVTELRPLLTGTRTLRVFIDTWVGPGHANGDGWLVDASFAFTGGVPAHESLAVVPLWSPSLHRYGDPAAPIELSAEVNVPAGATRALVRSFVTGHGQGNAGNCAEFCAREHAITIAGERAPRTIWRDDCRTTAVPNQAGTWTLSRAGWCPGDLVAPWTVERTLDAADPSLAIVYDVDPGYDNTCSPDADTCSACVNGVGCDYDGGGHTPPEFDVSSVIVFQR